MRKHKRINTIDDIQRGYVEKPSFHWFRRIKAKIRHWRYVRFIMYGNRESRRLDKQCR